MTKQRDHPLLSPRLVRIDSKVKSASRSAQPAVHRLCQQTSTPQLCMPVTNCGAQQLALL